MPSAGLHGPLHCHGHGVCTLSVPASTLALGLHAQWYCLLLLGLRGVGVHGLKYILLIPFECLTYHYPKTWRHSLNIDKKA